MSQVQADGPRWRWITSPDWTHPDHPEWETIEWDLHDEIVWNPRKVSKPVSGDDDDRFRYILTKDAPGMAHLPPMVVLIEIVREPTDADVGLVQGLSAWEDDDDLAMTLLRRVQGRPSV